MQAAIEKSVAPAVASDRMARRTNARSPEAMRRAAAVAAGTAAPRGSPPSSFFNVVVFNPTKHAFIARRLQDADNAAEDAAASHFH